MASKKPQTIHFSQERDFWGNLKRDLQELRGISTLVYELIQNADDVKKADDSSGGANQIIFHVNNDKLIVENDGIFSDCGHLDVQECPWKATKGHRCDFHRMKQVGGGDKRNQSANTGAFGIGFNAVYQITDHPEIISSGWHWKLYPENERDRRIIANRLDDAKGTRFILPWAFDPDSAVRKELRGCPAIQPNQIDDFVHEIEHALPKAAIFLKQINLLELYRNGKRLCRVERVSTERNIELTVNGQKIIWEIFRGDFSADAREIREKYRGVIEETRRNDVAIAVPDSLFVQGFLFADLPTEMSTNLPFHIEADFYPSSDRKRILLDDSISAEWNRLAIRSAARLMVESLKRIIGLYPPLQFWDWVAQVHKGGKDDLLDPVFSTFWAELLETLPSKSVMVTSVNSKTFVTSACLLESDEEIEATSVWESLDINIVHPDLRKHYGLFQELGTPRLRLSDITRGIKSKNLDAALQLSQMPSAMQTVSGIQRLWKAINLIWETRNRSSNDERDVATREFALLSIALGADGRMHPPKEMFIGDPLIQKILPEVMWLDEKVESPHPIPLSLVRKFSVADAISYLRSFPDGKLQTLWLEKKFSLSDFYHWLENNRDNVIFDQTVISNLKLLPIWPAGGKLQAISSLYLPGGFEDPLKLASVIDVAVFGGRTEYLRDVLRVKSLDFPTYVREQIPPAFQNHQSQSPELRTKLVQLLALRLGEIRDYMDVRYIVQKLPLVKCQDNEYYPAEQVYFDNESTRILGKNINLAASSKDHFQATEQLYEWMGVARQPRDNDILARIKLLTEQTPSIESRQAIQTIFVYLGQRWKSIYQVENSERRSFEQHFDSLKRIRWLPGSRNSEQWFSADTLFAAFNKYLFETQGNFLDFSLPIQRDASDFLEFLLVNRNPLPVHIVRHILYCSEHDLPVNWEVYRTLNYKDSLAEEQVLKELEGKACLLVSEEPVRYVRPDQVFWNDHPFGPYRYRIGSSLRAYDDLLGKLGVRSDPEIADYIQVILDIGEEFRTVPLDDIALGVVMSCWRKLSDALTTDIVGVDELKQRLCGRKVIPDPRQILTLPEHLFFEDRAGLASRFEALLKNNVIQRTEGCWLAMEAVGVQLLSRLIEVDLANEVDAEPDAYLASRIQERKLLIQRIIDAEQSVGVEVASGDKLLSLDYRRVKNLEIVMSIHAFNRRYQTDPESTNAVLMDNVFYSLWGNDGPSWPAIGRELALALKPSGEIGSLAMGIKEVLSAGSYQIASASLDELNYPPLQANEPTPEIQGMVIDLPVGDGGSASPELDFPTEGPSESGNAGDEGHGHKGNGHGKPKPRRRTSRIITYVYPDDALLDPDELSSAKSKKRTVTEQTGVALVIDDEKKYHRDAIDKNADTPNHPGYDLESIDNQTGVIRYIEVKSLSGYWDSANPVLVTKNEFETAQAKGDEFWLYIVERATSEDYQIHRIQNPANRTQYFVLDHGWEPLAVE